MIARLLKNEKSHRILLGFVLLASLLMLSGRYVATQSVMGGDAVIYYVNIRSILYDRDLDFRNEYEHFYNQYSPFTENRKLPNIPKENPDTGRVPILYPVGSVILLAPFFYLGHGISLLLQQLGFPTNPDGYGPIYQISVAAGSLIYAFLGLICAYGIGKKLFDPASALVGTLLIWVATPLIYYMTMEPLMSHALSMFGVAVFVWLWLLARERETWTIWLALGIGGGLLSINRYQDALFLVIPVTDLAIRLIAKPAKLERPRALYLLFLFLSGVALIVSIQFYVNFVLNGGPFSTGYKVEGYHPTTLFPHWKFPNLLYILFSTKSGLLLWAPVIGFSLFGLYRFGKANFLLSVPMIFALLLQFYLVSSWHDPTQGESFGNRYLVNSTVIFALGLMQFLDAYKNTEKFYKVSAFSGMFVLINGVLVILYCFRIIGGSY